MSDLIDRQAAIDFIDQHIFYDDYDNMDEISLIDGLRSLPSVCPEPLKISFVRELDRETAENIKKSMENAPVMLMAFEKEAAAQPERKKGEWILVKGSNGKDYHKCSECLHTQEITGVKNYCAVCGTDMRGEDHDT